MTKLNNRSKINKSKIRVGRGIGSGKGKTCGRGVKGQKSRSARNIFAQIIDDNKNVTLLSSSSIEKDFKIEKKISKMEVSRIVAEKLAKKAQEKKIAKIYFDRGIYKYHGRVKVFAETLRKNGMDF